MSLHVLFPSIPFIIPNFRLLLKLHNRLRMEEQRKFQPFGQKLRLAYTTGWIYIRMTGGRSSF